MLARDLTPADLADKWQCSTDHVIDLVRRGHLKGHSISPPGSKRPRYRIAHSAVSEYESLRQAGSPTKSVTRQSKRNEGVIEFYK